MITVSNKNIAPLTATLAQAKQTIGAAAAALVMPAGTTAVRLTFEKDSAATGSATPIARYWNNGLTPTLTEGVPVYDALTITLFKTELSRLEFIRAQAYDVTVNCEFYNVG